MLNHRNKKENSQTIPSCFITDMEIKDHVSTFFQSDGVSVYLGFNPGKTEGKKCFNTLKKVYYSLSTLKSIIH